MVRYCWIQRTHGAGVPVVGWLNCAMRAGRYRIDDAKMTGTTPAMLTLMGM